MRSATTTTFHLQRTIVYVHRYITSPKCNNWSNLKRKTRFGSVNSRANGSISLIKNKTVWLAWQDQEPPLVSAVCGSTERRTMTLRSTVVQPVEHLASCKSTKNLSKTFLSLIQIGKLIHLPSKTTPSLLHCCRKEKKRSYNGNFLPVAAY